MGGERGNRRERGNIGRGCGVVMDRNFGTSLGGNYYVCVQTLLITFAISLYVTKPNFSTS